MYIHTDIYYREDIYIERHTQGRHTHEGHTYGRGIYTKRQTKEHTRRNIHIKRHKHKGTYTRRDVYTEGHTYVGTYTQ